MSSPSIARGVIFSFLLFSIVACPLLLANTGTIVTKSGHRYVNAEYNLDRDFQAVLIDSAGHFQLIYFKDVQSIRDAQGRNVWDKSLVASPHSMISLRNGDAAMASQKPPKWRMSLRFGPAFNQPAASDYYNGYSSGIGWNGELELPIGRTLSIMLNVSRPRIQASKPQEWPESEFIWIRNWVTSGHTMRYMASCMFHQQWLDKRPGSPHWYVSGGIGIIDDLVTGSGIGRPRADTGLQILQFRRGGTHLAIGTGAGIVILFTKGIGLDIGGRADQILGTEYGDVSTGWAYILNLSASLLITIPTTEER